MSIIPLTSILFFVGLFAVTGFPPFGIFLTELSTLSAGTGSRVAIVAVAAIAMAIVFVGFFRHASAMILSEKSDELKVKPGENSVWLLVSPALLLVCALIATFYMPPFIQTLIHEAARQF
jgi:hydrogenase-4 component F